MGKAFRKPRPSPPKWYWWAFDNCWDCKNRNNCNHCKRMKQERAYEREKRDRKEKQAIRRTLQT